MSYILDMLSTIDTESGKKEGFLADQPDNCIVGYLSGGAVKNFFGGQKTEDPEITIQIRNLTYDGAIDDIEKVELALLAFSSDEVVGVKRTTGVKGLGKDSSGRCGFELRYTVTLKE